MSRPPKVHGRAFYESLNSPKHILAPMVDQSEFAWRLLTRSFLPPDLRRSVLAYSPMLHAKLFAEGEKYRWQHFEAVRRNEESEENEKEDLHLDGNPALDRPLIVQFCANEPEHFLQAAKLVQPYCDAVDLNLGCPQGIARRGKYGAFLQEDWDTIYKLINTLHKELDIPVTAKFRIQETREKTLAYAKMILSAGASFITVHGRQRHQKGHETGLADWTMLRFLREELPPETVIFANGNILQHGDIQRCLDATGADGVMTAEGNLYDPAIFATPPKIGAEGREYWRGRDGKGGYRADAVMRRYLDIIWEYVLEKEKPNREPLFLASDEDQSVAANGVAGNGITKPHSKENGARENDRTEGRSISANGTTEAGTNENHIAEPPATENGISLKRSASTSSEPTSKRQKRTEKKLSKKAAQSQSKQKPDKVTNPNLAAMQPHCFHILRSLVSSHHDVRDALARCRPGDMEAYENVMGLVESAVREGLREYERDPAQFETGDGEEEVWEEDGESSTGAVRRCQRPFWVCQPHVRPLPKEAFEKGSLQLSKKAKRKLEEEKAAGVEGEGRVAIESVSGTEDGGREETVEIPKEGVVCG